MSEEQKEREGEVFSQELSIDDLGAAAGGGMFDPSDADFSHCVQQNERNILTGGFPNCAATVEDGSLCGTNDACTRNAVNYKYMTDCHKAWR